MATILETIDAALARKGLSAARASVLAVGNPSLVKNLRSGQGRFSYESLQRLAAVLDLECYFGPPRSPNSPPSLGPALREALGLDSAAGEAEAVAALRRMPASGEAALRDLWLCRRARDRLSGELSRQLGVNRALLDALNETSADRARQLAALVALPAAAPYPGALAEPGTPYDRGPPPDDDQDDPDRG